MRRGSLLVVLYAWSAGPAPTYGASGPGEAILPGRPLGIVTAAEVAFLDARIEQRSSEEIARHASGLIGRAIDSQTLFFLEQRVKTVLREAGQGEWHVTAVVHPAGAGEIRIRLLVSNKPLPSKGVRPAREKIDLWRVAPPIFHLA